MWHERHACFLYESIENETRKVFSIKLSSHLNSYVFIHFLNGFLHHFLSTFHDYFFAAWKEKKKKMKKEEKTNSFDILLNVFFFISWIIVSNSKETIDNGLNIVIDIQLCSWRYARYTIQYVNEVLNNNKSAKLYAVRSEVLIDNCTKTHQYMDVSAAFDAI